MSVSLDPRKTSQRRLHGYGKVGAVDGGALGERIAAYRKRRGLSQATLAGFVGRSESWLSQVERGIRPVDRLSVMLDLAQVLKVDVETLLGRPWEYAPNGQHDLDDDLAAVRRHLARYDELLGPTGRTTATLAEIRDQVAAGHETYQAARYRVALAQLPAVLGAVDPLRHGPSGADRRERLFVYVTGYVLAAKLLTKLGAADLALVAADRSAMASLDTDSFTAQGMAAYQVVCALLRADRMDEAEELAVSMAGRATDEARAGDPEVVSVAGALWLIAAVIAARRAERFAALDRLDHAGRLAAALGEDGNYAWTAFGPTNVAIHRVSVAAELGDAAEALEVASRLDTEHLPPGLTSRRAQMHLDLAWAHAQRRRDADSTLHLLEAERSAPEVLRFNAVVRELIRELLGRQGRTSTRALNDLAVRAGVLD